MAILLSLLNSKVSRYDEKIAKLLRTSLLKSLKGTDGEAKFTKEPPPSHQRLETELDKWPPVLCIMEWPTEEVARQLTLVDSELFRMIRAHEFLDLGWSKKDKDVRAPNILGFIGRFNHVSMWAATCVLKAEKLEDRRQVAKKFVELAWQCLQLNNLNCVLAICSGLNNSAVHRLKKTWDELPPEVVEKRQKLQELFDPQKSYKNLREHVVSVNPPCIPYLGMYLTDLTFINDGNPTFTQEGLVNIKKGTLTAGVVAKVQLYQQVPYVLTRVSVLHHHLSNLVTDDDNALYASSLKCEPRK